MCTCRVWEGCQLTFICRLDWRCLQNALSNWALTAINFLLNYSKRLTRTRTAHWIELNWIFSSAHLLETLGLIRDSLIQQSQLKLVQLLCKDGWLNGGKCFVCVWQTLRFLSVDWHFPPSMTTLLDHRTTLKYLAYLGFEGDTRTALKITKPKKVDRKKGKIQRNVFSCYVFGAPGSGKVMLSL